MSKLEIGILKIFSVFGLIGISQGMLINIHQIPRYDPNKSQFYERKLGCRKKVDFFPLYDLNRIFRLISSH